MLTGKMDTIMLLKYFMLFLRRGPTILLYYSIPSLKIVIQIMEHFFAIIRFMISNKNPLCPLFWVLIQAMVDL